MEPSRALLEAATPAIMSTHRCDSASNTDHGQQISAYLPVNRKLQHKASEGRTMSISVAQRKLDSNKVMNT